MKHLSYFLLSACSALSVSPLWADSVRLTNGSNLQGTFLSVSDGKLQMDTGYGKLAIPLKDIQTMDSDNPVWVRVKGEHDFVHGEISAGGQGLQIHQSDGTVRQVEEADSLAMLTVQNPDKEVWRYTGNANVYFSMDRGNDHKDSLSADGRLTARDRINRHSVDFKSEKEEDKESTTKDRWLVKYSYNRFLNPSWYVLGNAGWEQNKMQSLNSRTTLGVGAGHQFWDEPGLNLKVELGVSQIWEKYTDPDDKRNNQAIHWALNYDQKVWEQITLFHDQDIFRRLSSSSWLLQTATGLRYKLTDLLHLSLRYEFDYEGDPQPGKKESDSSLLFGLGASW